MSLDTDVTHDDDLDRRLRAALDEIAGHYTARHVTVEPLAADARPLRNRQRRRAVLLGSVAASALVMVSAGVGVWAVRDRADGQPPNRAVTTAPPRPAEFGDGFTVPDVPGPARAVRLRSPLAIGGFELINRYDAWRYSQEPIESRWYVHTTDGQVDMSLVVADHPAWQWPLYESGDPYAPLPELDARFVPSGNGVAWLHGDTVRLVSLTTSFGTGSSSFEALVAEVAGLDDLASFEPPAYFEEIAYTPMESWQYNESGWSIGTFAPPRGDAELIVDQAWLQPDARRIEGGWLVRTESPSGETGGWSAWVLVDAVIVVVHAPGYVDDQLLAGIAELIAIVPAAQVGEGNIVATALGGSQEIERARPVAGGELPWGRWLAVDPAPRGTPDDIHCVALVGAVEVSGCAEPGALDLTMCSARTDTAERVTMVTTIELAGPQLPLEVVVGGEPVEATIERSGGLTFITATVETPSTMRVTTADGTQLCPA